MNSPLFSAKRSRRPAPGSRAGGSGGRVGRKEELLESFRKKGRSNQQGELTWILTACIIIVVDGERNLYIETFFLKICSIFSASGPLDMDTNGPNKCKQSRQTSSLKQSLDAAFRRYGLSSPVCQERRKGCYYAVTADDLPHRSTRIRSWRAPLLGFFCQTFCVACQNYELK